MALALALLPHPLLVAVQLKFLAPVLMIVELQTVAPVPTFIIAPSEFLRNPEVVQRSVDPKAPDEPNEGQLNLSASNSGSVGILNPGGQGLLLPEYPCHNDGFCGERQSAGEDDARIKSLWPGVSELLRDAVVALVRS